MRVGESKSVYGIANSKGNIYIDSFQNTENLAKHCFAKSCGKSWDQCVKDESVTCKLVHITLNAIQ